MAEAVECVVVGAGVVGLAIGRALAEAGREVVVLEKEAAFGTETSARNSEVIHAGIYYPPGSLKARLCVEGRRLLYAFCAGHGIAHQRCGKLIVATDEDEIAGLDRLLQTARANGVDDMRRLDAQEAIALEPNLRCIAALLSPSSGILDSHQYMTALLGGLEAAGGALARNSRMVRAMPSGGGLRAEIAIGDGETFPLDCRTLVNAAGLSAQRVAAAVDGMPPARIPRQYLAKGSYFLLGGRAPFQRLVYPMPSRASLGLHYSRDLGGQARFGPDVEWVDTLDYGVDPARAALFEDSIRRYYPALPRGALVPGYAGVRPKIVPAGAPPADFVVQGPAEHGVAGLINLFGIESPGLTSSLAIGQYVAAMVAA